MSEPAL